MNCARPIISAANGQVHLAPQAMAGLLREVRAPQPIEAVEPLTERQTEVLRHLSQGLSNKEIALRLNISEQTVKSHVHNLLNKLRVSSRTQAALYGVHLGPVKGKPNSQVIVQHAFRDTCRSAYGPLHS